MRKMYAAAAFCAVAIVAVAAVERGSRPGATEGAREGIRVPDPVNTLDSKGKAHTTSITVTGKVKTRSACLAGRKVEFT